MVITIGFNCHQQLLEKAEKSNERYEKNNFFFFVYEQKRVFECGKNEINMRSLRKNYLQEQDQLFLENPTFLEVLLFYFLVSVFSLFDQFLCVREARGKRFEEDGLNVKGKKKEKFTGIFGAGILQHLDVKFLTK